MKKILVCEDEAAIRDFVVINLTRAGYDVVEADCGEAALQKYEEHNGDFDVAILDVMMPKINGYKISRLLKYDSKYKDIPIIMVTARSQLEDKMIGEETGVNEYITKPFELDAIVKKVESYLGGGEE